MIDLLLRSIMMINGQIWCLWFMGKPMINGEVVAWWMARPWRDQNSLRNQLNEPPEHDAHHHQHHAALLEVQGGRGPVWAACWAARRAVWGSATRN